MCKCGGVGQWEIDGTSERLCAVCVADLLRLVFGIFAEELAAEQARRNRR